MEMFIERVRKNTRYLDDFLLKTREPLSQTALYFAVSAYAEALHQYESASYTGTLGSVILDLYKTAEAETNSAMISYVKKKQTETELFYRIDGLLEQLNEGVFVAEHLRDGIEGAKITGRKLKRGRPMPQTDDALLAVPIGGRLPAPECWTNMDFSTCYANDFLAVLLWLGLHRPDAYAGAERPAPDYDQLLARLTGILCDTSPSIQSAFAILFFRYRLQLAAAHSAENAAALAALRDLQKDFAGTRMEAIMKVMTEA